MTRRNKRAGLSISLSTIIDVVLVTIALLVLFGIYKAVTGIFSESSDKEAATRNNFRGLADAYNAMKQDEKRDMPLYVSDRWFIVGFTKDSTVLPAQCGTSKTVQKPSNCMGNCICLCTVKEACQSKTECRSLDGDYAFKSPCYRGTGKPIVASLSKAQGAVTLSTTKQ